MVTAIAVIVAFLAGAGLATLFHSRLRAEFAGMREKFDAAEKLARSRAYSIEDRARGELLRILGR